MSKTYFGYKKKKFDTMWITLPAACLIAVIFGDVSGWVIFAIAASTIRINL